MVPHLKKLEDRCHMMISNSYKASSKAYRTYNHIMKPIHVTCDVVFDVQV